MWLIAFLLQLLNISYAFYDTHLVNTALNISQASYCMSGLDKWSCATCSNTNIYETMITRNDELVVFGYNTEYRAIFIGFRGSSNIQNWIDNLHISKISPYEEDDILVEKGFYSIYNALRPDVYRILNDLTDKYGTSNILLTGHSLGGAIATLFSFDFCYYNAYYNTFYIITFGSPRVGNDIFSSYFNSCHVKSIRITHYYDMVPHVPEEMLGYKHISQEVWYNEENSEYQLCDDVYSEDPLCSDSCAPIKCTSTSDHLNYLNISMGNNGLC
jgi:hypothetical protein